MAIKTWISPTNVNWNTAQAWSPTGVPTASDDCVFNSAVATTATITASTSIRSLNCTGFTGTITGAPNLSLGIGGDLTLSAGMVFISGNTPTVIMNPAGTGTATITSAGQTIAAFEINTFGTVTLADALNVTIFTHTLGTFNSNGQTVNATNYLSSSVPGNARVMTMGASVFNLSGSGNVWIVASTSNSYTLNPGTSDIRLTATAGVSRTFSGGGLTYNTLTIAGGGGVSSNTTIVGSNTFGQIAWGRSTVSTVTFQAGSVTTMTNWFIGATGNTYLIPIVSSTPGTQYTLRKPTPWYIGPNSTATNSSGLIISVGGAVNFLAFTDAIGEVTGGAAPSGFFNFF